MYRSLTHKSLLHYPERFGRPESGAWRCRTPLWLVAHFQASIIYDLMNDDKSANSEYELGLKAPCTSELDWIARGSAAMKNHPNDAIDAFDQALRMDPSLLIALRNKAVVLSKQGFDQQAVQVLDDTVKLYPGSVWSRMSRGTLLARLGKRDLAIKDAEASLKLDPRPMTHYRVAGIYAATSRQHPDDATLALGNLAAALKAGYGADLVEKDPDLAPIKSLPEFQKLWTSAQMLSNTAQRAGVR